MKKYLSLILLILIVSSCSKRDNEAIIVNFEVQNMSYSKVAIVGKGLVEEVNLDKNGQGSCTLQGDVIYASLYYGEQEKKLFLQKGDVVTILFDAEDFRNSIRFEGESVPVLEYMNSHTYPRITPDKLSNPLEEVHALIQESIEAATNELASFNLDKVNPRFVELEKGRIKYMFASNLIIYPMVHTMADSQYRPDESYYSLLESYMEEKETLLDINSYKEFVMEAALVLASKERHISDSYSRTLAKMNYIAQNFQNKKIAETIINEIAIRYIDMNGAEEIEELTEIHNNNVTNAKMKAAFRAACNS